MRDKITNITEGNNLNCRSDLYFIFFQLPIYGLYHSISQCIPEIAEQKSSSSKTECRYKMGLITDPIAYKNIKIDKWGK